MYGLSPVATSSKVLKYQGKLEFFQPVRLDCVPAPSPASHALPPLYLLLTDHSSQGLAAGVAGAADGTDAPVYAGNVLRQLPSVDRQKVPPMVTGRDRADRTSGLPFPLDLLGQLPAVLVPQHIHQGQGVNGACSSAG